MISLDNLMGLIFSVMVICTAILTFTFKYTPVDISFLLMICGLNLFFQRCYIIKLEKTREQE